MRLFSREASRYAALLILLFTIAALAVWHTLSLLEGKLDNDDYVVVASLICVISLGFMLIAGAFGLWAIQFAAREEARRRISQLVDAMDYLSDGILLIDAKRQIIGNNPAAQSISGLESIKGLTFDEAFSSVKDSDAKNLFVNEGAFEIELTTDENRIIRFRSLPSGGLTLILVSDVTHMQARRDASRQAARLQLMGEISRGVAHDFNNLLCTIAGHTSLLPRLKFDSGDFALSLAAVNRAVEKGTALAGHLIELTRPIPTLMFSPLPAKSIESAANQLKDTLPSDWEYDIRVDGLPTVALSSARIEQIVLNLGIIAADQASAPGTLSVYAAPPGKVKRLFHTESYFGAVIIVTTAGVLDDTWRSPTPTEDGDSGVILSVIRSLLEQSKSRLDVIHTTHGTPIYRVCIPISSIPQDEAESSRITTELGPYLANWNILLAMRSSAGARMEVRMSKLNITLQRVESLPSLLAKVESGEALDGIVIDKSLVEEETGAIIKAIIKLCPNSAIVVMAQSPKEDDRSMLNDVVLVPNEATPNQVMLALVEAKALSVRRNRS